MALVESFDPPDLLVEAGIESGNLKVREHRKPRKQAFAARHGLIADRS